MQHACHIPACCCSRAAIKCSTLCHTCLLQFVFDLIVVVVLLLLFRLLFLAVSIPARSCACVYLLTCLFVCVAVVVSIARKPFHPLHSPVYLRHLPHPLCNVASWHACEALCSCPNHSSPSCSSCAAMSGVAFKCCYCLLTLCHCCFCSCCPQMLILRRVARCCHNKLPAIAL